MILQVQPGFSIEGDSGSVMWRYMDLEKFILLLQRRSLYFPLYTELGDPWEGAPRLRNISEGFGVMVQCLVELAEQNPSVVEGTPEFADVVLQLQGAIPEYAKKLPMAGISCWHSNLQETAAMWDLYAGRRKGIAIKTSLANLEASLEENPDVTFLAGAVRYVDFNNTEERVEDRLDHLFLKWHHYQYEKEIRIVAIPNEEAIQAASQPIKGYSIPVNLEQLCDQVLVAPGQPPRISEMIRGLLDKYELDPNILTRSAMDESPEEWIDRHTRYTKK